MPNRSDVEHLLRRTEFAARRPRVDALQPLSLAAAVDDILAVPTGAVHYPTSLRTHVRTGNYEQYRLAVHWWFDRMATESVRPVQERMALFWHGHLCSIWDVVGRTPWMMDQNDLFRRQGLGNFRTLVSKASVQPAMLRYLDNEHNVASSPNQNFARELLELFLLGVGNYTEDDVEAATRAWTGYTIGGDGRFVFDAGRHDSGMKTFLGRTGNWNGTDIINIVLGSSATIVAGDNAGLPARVVAARFLSRKLWESFAYPDPDDVVVAALADSLISANWEIKPWVRTMLLRPEFLSARAKTAHVRSPAEYVGALLYHAAVPAAVAHPEWYSASMGQSLYAPPDVNGWGVGDYWLNGSAITGRAEFADSVRRRLTKGRPDGELVLRGGRWSWHDLDAMSPVRLVDSIASGLEVTLTPTTRSAIIEWASGEYNWSSPDWWRTSNALFLTMLSPEMNVV